MYCHWLNDLLSWAPTWGCIIETSFSWLELPLTHSINPRHERKSDRESNFYGTCHSKRRNVGKDILFRCRLWWAHFRWIQIHILYISQSGSFTTINVSSYAKATCLKQLGKSQRQGDAKSILAKRNIPGVVCERQWYYWRDWTDGVEFVFPELLITPQNTWAFQIYCPCIQQGLFRRGFWQVLCSHSEIDSCFRE